MSDGDDDTFRGLRRHVLELRDQLDTTQRKLDAQLEENKRLRAWHTHLLIRTHSPFARDCARRARNTTLWPHGAAPAASSTSRGPVRTDDE